VYPQLTEEQADYVISAMVQAYVAVTGNDASG
jgi:hypothetical protein